MNAPVCPVHVSRKMKQVKDRPKLHRSPMNGVLRKDWTEFDDIRWRCPVSGCPQVKAT